MTKGITMLVLSRKVGEKIEVGDDITVMVVEIRDDKVRIGVQAPENVPVHREEIAELIRQQTEQVAANIEDD